MAYQTVTLTGKFLDPTGIPLRGSVQILPNVQRITDAAGNVILSGGITAPLDASGAFSAILPATNDVGLSPTNFQYSVWGPGGVAITISLPAGTSPVDLADVVPVTPAPVATADLADATVAGLVNNTASATRTVLNSKFAFGSDTLALRRLADVGRADTLGSSSRSTVSFTDTPALSETWANLAAWTATGVQVSGGKLFATGDAGNNSAAYYGFGTANPPTRMRFKTKVTIPAASGGATGALLLGFTSATSGTPATNSYYGIQISPSSNAVNEWQLGTPATATKPTANSLGPTIAAGDYVVTGTADERGTSVTLSTVTGDKVTTVYYPRTSFTPKAPAIFLADTRALTGFAVWNYIARADTVTGATTVESYGPSHWWGYTNTADTHGALIITPTGYDSRKPIDWLLHHHGAGQGELDLYEDSAHATVVTAAVAGGYGLMSIRGQSAGSSTDCWGADGCVTAGHTLGAYKYLRDHYAMRNLILWGTSMGSLATLNVLMRREIPNVIGWLGTYPATNLAGLFNNNVGANAPAIRTAYGIASDGSDYSVKTAGHDPNLALAPLFRGIPMRFYASPADTTVSKATNSDAFAASVAPYVPEATVVTCSGNHGDASHFQPSDYIAFFDRCSGK